MTPGVTPQLGMAWSGCVTSDHREAEVGGHRLILTGPVWRAGKSGRRLNARRPPILVCSAYFTATAYRKEKPACFGRRAFVIDFASVTLAMALSGGVQSLAGALLANDLTASLRFRGRDALGVACACAALLIWIGTIHH